MKTCLNFDVVSSEKKLILKIWNILRGHENTQNLILREICRDVLCLSLKDLYRKHIDLQHKNSGLIINKNKYTLVLIVEIIMMILTEINKDLIIFLTNFKQNDQSYLKNIDLMRNMEEFLSLMSEILISLSQNNKINLFQEFINKEVIYILTQVKKTNKIKLK